MLVIRVQNIFIFSMILLLSCCVTPTENSTPATANQVAKGETEYLCEALCTYKNREGALRRINLASRNRDQKLAWNNLKDQCLEIQNIGRSNTILKSKDPLVVAETIDHGSAKEYELSEANMQRDCFTYSKSK